MFDNTFERIAISNMNNFNKLFDDSTLFLGFLAIIISVGVIWAIISTCYDIATTQDDFDKIHSNQIKNQIPAVSSIHQRFYSSFNQSKSKENNRISCV